MTHLCRYGLMASLAAATFVAGLWLGGSEEQHTTLPMAVHRAQTTTGWTCSMHPHIHRAAPGTCPICGMPLVPTDSLPAAEPAPAAGPMLVLSEQARTMASIETVPVTRRALTKEIRVVGKVQYNETGLATVVTRVDGFIEKLFVDSTGVRVHKGDHLVEIYSQDLEVAQRELLIARHYPSGTDTLLESTKAKMRQWGVMDEEIEKILKTGKALPRLTRYAPIAGTVTEKMVVEGSFVNRGDVLYRLADLDSVWVYLDIYEYEISWVQPGQHVEFSAEALPGQTLYGLVTFVNPILHEDTRTIKVRVNVDNRDGKLKPGMFVSAVLRVPLLANGRPGPTGAEGKFLCPMHPHILHSEAGTCPICGMPLSQLFGSAVTVAPETLQVLAVPVSAVLDSGQRRLVYVEKSRGEFVPAEITVGPRAGEFYAVVSGLQEGDNVAVRGNFLLDSQFQIKGLPSLLYREGLAPAAGHQHGAAPTVKPAEAAEAGGRRQEQTPKPQSQDAPASHQH
ncbi:MAG: efflux RND transporter periplasmic adaptor subunit [Candidatus Tectimicrobiota bacterium]